VGGCCLAYAFGFRDEGMRTLDRLIGLYGPNADATELVLQLVEERRRAMEERARAMEERAAVSAAEEDTPDGRGRKAAGDDATGGTPERSGSSAQAGQPTDQGESGTDEVTEGMGSRPNDDSSTAADEEPVGNRCPATGDVENVAGTTSAPQAEGDAGAPEAESQGAPADGGGSAVKVSPTLARVAEVARIARALSRLLADATRPEPSPLWDGRRVVRELVSRQVRMHRMRRDVPAVRGLLVLYDTSGSCAWIAARTWGIAAALAERYAGLYAAPTCSEAGGEGSLAPAEIVGRDTKRFRTLPAIEGYGADADGWRRIRAAGISHLLALGDAHGEPGYRAAAAAGIKILWVNPNEDIGPDDTSWCAYTLITNGDIAAAVETVARRAYA
jgi:hypothetical protein